MVSLERLAVLSLWRLEFRQLFQDLDLGLSLSGSVGIVTPPVDEGLQRRSTHQLEHHRKGTGIRKLSLEDAVGTVIEIRTPF
jgi:hypothetical protein